MDESTSTSVSKTLLLIGGGHAHALCLRKMGIRPIAGLRVVLVSDVIHAPYSGMLPGLVAGHYTFDETHISLKRLADFAGVDFVSATATGLDLKNKLLFLDGCSPKFFDILSINIGSTPSHNGVPDASQYTIPAKPVAEFLKAWDSVLSLRDSRGFLQINIVGGGAGGVELALSMRRRLGPKVPITLLHQDKEILPSHNKTARKILSEILKDKGVTVKAGTRIIQALPDRVLSDRGEEFPATHTFWITSAAPPVWLKESGLAVDDEGFIKVNCYLQSISHEFVFAAGDIATIAGAKRPKSGGVFAVRQAKPLLKNLYSYVKKEKLRPYYPQTLYLSLIGTGDGNAVASWGPLVWCSKLLWALKERIDRRFMRKFTQLPKNLSP